MIEVFFFIIEMSQSNFQINFEFVGTNKIVTGEILRLQSPLTIETIIDKAPFTVRSRGNLGRKKTFWMVLIDIKKGGEKSMHKKYEIGDIVYCPRQDALFLIYDDAPEIPFPVYFLGKITAGLEDLKTMRNGTMVKISFKDIS
jgi:hypothetical protein